MVKHQSTSTTKKQNTLLDSARDAIRAEASAIELTASRLDDSFLRAVKAILNCPGKVIITGLGKSGHVARKLAATFCSTGTQAVFLHAAEAVHGDLGICCEGDPAILISKSGATYELLQLVPLLRNLKSPLIGILGNLSSPLAAEVDFVLDARVSNEADALNLVPTCSSAVAMAIGDALAIALMQARQFSQHDFARRHPSGQLGRNLWLSVADVMHDRSKTAMVAPVQSFREVVIAMTNYPLGAACVIDPGGKLSGIVTDGDLRRALQQYEEINGLSAQDVMTKNPVTISPAATLKEAALLMEARSSQISVLPVVDGEFQYLGLIRIHDLYRHRE